MYKVTYAVFSEPGGRAVNEDSVGVFQEEDRSCFVLCDGLGGHGMGDVASALAVEVFGDQFRKTDDMTNFLGQTFSTAQEVLMSEQKARNARQKMKTTGTAVALDDRNAYIGHVGDSRVYLFQRNKKVTRTQDHSIPQMLVLSGEIKESQIRNHPDRNIILRVMGVNWDEPMYELMAPVPLRKCQAFLLCSDGFWELIEDADMCRLLKNAQTVDQWMAEMVQIVRANGIGKNMDNFSAIAVWITQEKRRFF